MMSTAMYDVAIIGGGPAGSTTAALLARAGRRVIVFEREKFPRFHIGESLLPFSMKAFTRLGLHEKFLRAGFLKKFGGEIVGACSENGTKFYFNPGALSNRRQRAHLGSRQAIQNQKDLRSSSKAIYLRALRRCLARRGNRRHADSFGPCHRSLVLVDSAHRRPHQRWSGSRQRNFSQVQAQR